jgi:tetratricopeptide (TPR) repeat protein
MRCMFTSLLLFCFGAAAAAPLDPATSALIEGNHWKRLRAIAEPRVAANPNDAEAAYLLAYVKFTYRDLNGAQALVEKALSIDGRNADYHFLLARIIGQKASDAGITKGLGYVSQIKKEQDAALSLNPNHIEALLDKMEFYWEAPWVVGGSKKKAAEIADRITRINPARGYLAQADLATREKERDWAKIDALCLRAAQSDPQSYPAHMSLANNYASERLKNYDEAERLAHEAIKLDPGRAGAYS